jgi:hypothetical protein
VANGDPFFEHFRQLAPARTPRRRIRPNAAKAGKLNEVRAVGEAANLRAGYRTIHVIQL